MEKYKRLTIETEDGKYELDCGACPNKHYDLCFESDCSNVALKRLIELEDKIDKGQLTFAGEPKSKTPLHNKLGNEKKKKIETLFSAVEEEFDKFLEELTRGENNNRGAGRQ